MRSALSSRAGRAVCAATIRGRQLATHATTTPAVTYAENASLRAGREGALRPHLGIEVNPNHGLWGFFRRQEKDGKVTHETVEPIDVVHDKSGRAWTAAELRRKSFKDLHTLWYVVLRERNLLATQQAEGRRLGANEQALGLWDKAYRCRKTMARIKYVINERRLAYEGAMQIHNEKRDELLQLADVERAMEEAKAAEAARKEEKAKRRQGGVEDVVSQSLFETVPEAVAQKA
ncbi:MRP-L47-domain-containing protein [Lentinus tigrinus ALCF2SS1-7]|uniref:Large ribosomal subunit protein uL29m n=1 Tax=Lentinus tigrinus ALCF2SS1-6 TaxID=1328759 RepID=A0A5C2SFI1_9APHY|nr:MRP-L47-domain-containing protein [Lentinus tigrinus ALCF2SS1-6]RPD77804.1 MRP-L47-domain-containing protein [Lentinus tigrinus ALCF2SS1-7]